MKEREVLTTILENLQTKVSPQMFAAYFADLEVVSIEDNVVTIACKNAYTRNTLESKFYNTILNVIRSVLNIANIELQLVIKSLRTSPNNSFSLFNSPPKTTSFTSEVPKSLENHIITQPQIAKTSNTDSFLNKKYTFDTFIVGSHNQLPHAAALAISDNPGNVYNPFFIYGNVGLGKTHLMQAIGNQVIKNNQNAKVLYCTTETFLNEMVSSIRTQKTSAFREKYRAMDLLILDDIQFLSNKEALQEEFFNTFNTLYQAGKQIIIASDRPPSEISHLEDRIRSRFEGGLVADIKNPNVETRIAIIQNKLIERNEFLPETLILTIAESIDTNIRELEGALLKVSIHYKTQGNLTADEVRAILGSKIISKRKKINPLELMNLVCEQLQIEMKDVKSTKRNYDIAYARQICMFLLKDVLNLQLIKIAKHVGRKDHTTVIHGINKIEEMIKEDPDTAKIISDIKAKI